MVVSMNKAALVEIQLEEIASATDYFNDSNCIGSGGFGKVFKGELHQFKERSLVAIKRLSSIHGQGVAEYRKEIAFLSRYTHDNLISLLGFCNQGKEMILVYEHASRGSLDRHLHSAGLTWKQRVTICLGAAKGLNYLHDPRETGQRLIHCDVKSANILLDDKWNAKVADFGLSKIAPANMQNSILITNAFGTHGYCDPLFLESCTLTKESDVYSFGVVLFEVLCGEVCTRIRNGQLQVLVSMWKKSYEEKKLDEFILKDLRQNMDQTSFKIFSGIAYECLKGTREERPTISFVVERLAAALRCIQSNKVELLEIQLEEIASATNNFNDSYCIGDGGSGKVYEGALPQFNDRNLVAIKRLSSMHGQGGAEYRIRIAFLSRYTHDNLISLLGFCNQGKEMILVYEHASRGSLDRHLHSADLTWKQRVKICLGAAKGLNYLHDPRETGQRLIHRDIKSAHILLDYEWNAKVADFGLSNPSYAENPFLTVALDTLGYCDPLYMETYTLTKESDVYSFGVVLFEVLCGKVCTRIHNGQLQVLVDMWKRSYEEKKLDEIIFKDLRQNVEQTSLEIFSGIAYECLKRNREERPRMSVVVEKLWTALRCLKVKQPKEYEEIVDAVPPLIFESLIFKSTEELKVLLSKGFYVNGGKTCFSINDKKEHILLISIKECLILDSWEGGNDQYCLEYNSRFEVGTYSTRGEKFETRVITEFLSPRTTYAVNLIFKCPKVLKEKSGEQYIFLTFTLLSLGEKRRTIVYIRGKSEDEWLRARLHQFTTTSDLRSSIQDLEFSFEDHEYRLQIEGIELQQIKVNAEDLKAHIDENKYLLILKSAEPRLMYTSTKELNLDVLFSKGLLINGGKWFHLNDKGQHCEFISIKQCLIPDPKEIYIYNNDCNSRFPVGTLYVLSCNFKVGVRAQFLTPLVTYTVNLVFKFKDEKKLHPKEAYIGLRYKLEGQTKTSISYYAEKRELDDWWMVELCHFTSEQGTTFADLQFMFEHNKPWIVVEGIEFLPVEKVEKVYMEEDQVLEDEKVDDNIQMQQPISSSDSNTHSDTYWEQKLPNDYEDIMKMAKYSVPMNTTKKELYSIFSRGIPTNNGEEWLSIDNNGKKCLMLSPRAAFKVKELSSTRWFKWQSSLESRFDVKCADGEYESRLAIKSKIRSKLLSAEIRYANYLVYKLPPIEKNRDYPPLKVEDGRDLGSDPLYVYLVGGPTSPVVINVIGGKVVVGSNLMDRVFAKERRDGNRVFAKERRDGWMEVRVSEFQTPNTTTTTDQIIPISLKLEASFSLGELIIRGIEFRPV